MFLISETLSNPILLLFFWITNCDSQCFFLTATHFYPHFYQRFRYYHNELKSPQIRHQRIERTVLKGGNGFQKKTIHRCVRGQKLIWNAYFLDSSESGLAWRLNFFLGSSESKKHNDCKMKICRTFIYSKKSFRKMCSARKDYRILQMWWFELS